MHLPDLRQLLRYENPAILKLYRQNYPNNSLTAEEAFTEVLKYLWLCRKHELDYPHLQDNPHFPDQCFMPRSMREIDEMWHEFILFTQDYSDFCDHYFESYMHHLPNIFDNMPRPRDIVEREVEKLLHYIHQHLGEETVKVWFASYLDPVQTTSASLHSLSS
jgi:hypothetical protein